MKREAVVEYDMDEDENGLNILKAEVEIAIKDITGRKAKEMRHTCRPN